MAQQHEGREQFREDYSRTQRGQRAGYPYEDDDRSETQWTREPRAGREREYGRGYRGEYGRDYDQEFGRDRNFDRDYGREYGGRGRYDEGGMEYGYTGRGYGERGYGRELSRRPYGAQSEYGQGSFSQGGYGSSGTYGMGSYGSGGQSQGYGQYQSAYSGQGQGGWSGQGSQQQRPSFRGKGPQGYERSDERLKEIVCERLTDDDEIDASRMTVEVRSGEVTVNGEVDDRATKFRVEELIENCGGVKDVHNHLRVSREGQQFGGERSGQAKSATKQQQRGSSEHH